MKSETEDENKMTEKTKKELLQEILDRMEELENNEEKSYNMKWANLQGKIEGIMIREKLRR